MEEGQEGAGPPPLRARPRVGRWRRAARDGGRGRLPAGCRGGGGVGVGGRIGAEHAGGRAPAVQVRGQALLLFIVFQGEIETLSVSELGSGVTIEKKKKKRSGFNAGLIRNWDVLVVLLSI